MTFLFRCRRTKSGSPSDPLANITHVVWRPARGLARSWAPGIGPRQNLRCSDGPAVAPPVSHASPCPGAPAVEYPRWWSTTFGRPSFVWPRSRPSCAWTALPREPIGGRPACFHPGGPFPPPRVSRHSGDPCGRWRAPENVLRAAGARAFRASAVGRLGPRDPGRRRSGPRGDAPTPDDFCCHNPRRAAGRKQAAYGGRRGCGVPPAVWADFGRRDTSAGRSLVSRCTPQPLPGAAARLVA